jgi:3-oxoacyl-[acyl-carrier protein] reductase
MSERELQGRVAIVTGGARNIGRAIALDLADGGANVTVVARSDMKGIRSTVSEIEARGCKALGLQIDVTSESDVKRMVDETLARFGRIDILVNNAGIRLEAAVEDLSLQAWRDVMAVSLDGAFLCVKAALAALAKTKGTIVNIGGLTAYTGAIHRAHVVAAKAGLDGLTKALAVELAPRGITCNLVAPGMIDTVREGAEPAHRRSRTMLSTRRGRPDDVSAMVRFLVGPKGHYLTGQTIHVSGGAVLP